MLRNFFIVAFRNLVRFKTFSAINLTGLAIGLTCFLFISLFIRSELHYDRFHEKHDRIYRLVSIEDDGDGTTGVARVSAQWGPALQETLPEIVSSVRFRFYGRTLVRAGDKWFYESNGLFADSTIFDIFSFPMLHGRPESALTAPNSIVLTEAMAQKYFGNENPLGKIMQFDDQASYQVTGVVKNVPEHSHFRFDFLVSFATYDFWDLPEWRVNNFHNYVLLAPHANSDSVESRIPALLKNRMGDDEYLAMETTQKLQPLTSIHLHSNLFREFEPNSDIAYVYLFSAIAFFVLLLASINFMNLSTARASKRAREVGMRKVVGAQRQQLIKQFLGESILFAMLAFIIAVGLAEMLMPTFRELTGRNLSLNFVEDPMLLLLLAGVAILTGILSGSYPALFLSAFKPIGVLRGKSLSNSRSPLRKALVILQFTVSIALISSTMVVFKQLDFIQNRKLGFDKEQVLVLRIADSPIEARPQPFMSELLQSSDVLSVSATDNLPGGSDWGMPFHYEGAADGQVFSSRVLSVDHAFVATMGMKIANGRDFSKELSDDRGEAFVLNQAAVRELGWENPVGKYLERPLGRGPDGNWQWRRGLVVGVVEDFNFRSLHTEIQPLVMFLNPEDASYLNVKIAGTELPKTLSDIESLWLKHVPDRPFDALFLNDVFNQMYQAEQQLSKIFAAFSFVAIVIGCLGLLGLMSFLAEQRTKEIGVRKVLGASVPSLLFLLSKEFVALIGIAFVIAAGLAYWAMSAWLQAFAYRTSLSPEIFLLAGLATLVASLLTVSYQALKAALANPVKSLQYE